MGERERERGRERGRDRDRDRIDSVLTERDIERETYEEKVV